MDTKRLLVLMDEVKKEAHRLGLAASKMGDAELMDLVTNGGMTDLGHASSLMIGTGKYMQGLIAERIGMLDSKALAVQAVDAWNAGIDPACASCPCEACESERAAARKALHR